MARSSMLSLVGLTGLLGLLFSPLTLVVRAQAPAVAPLPDELVQRLVTPTELIATVGDQTIFAADILPTIDQMLQNVTQRIPADQMDQQRAIFVQQMLPRKVEVKLVLLDFYRSIPEDKLKEVIANIDKQVGKQFYEEQVPVLQEQFEADFLGDLESKLRSFGTSITSQKAEFREQMIARTMIGQNVNRSPEITRDELLEYYLEHSKDYDVPARARWEKLTALFDKFPTRADADRAIVEMGNQVLRGANFATVAKKHSQGTNAFEGGLHDWTTQGSLVSEVLDKAIFTMPLQRLSQKLEDERGYHIIRVTARQDAQRIRFEEAQNEIREKLQDENRKKQVREYVEGLREKTYIWTAFDDLPEKTAQLKSMR